jgi:hypothetical protein
MKTKPAPSRPSHTRTLCVAFAAILVLELGLSAFAPQSFAYVSTARADDDDGGGGGGVGGGASGGGGDFRVRGPSGGGDIRRLFRGFRRAFQPQRRTTRRAAVRAPAPAPALREIVGLDITDAQVSALQAAGFTVLGRDALTTVGTTITRLRPPGNVRADEARALVLAQAPQAIVDDNHLYAAQSAAAAPCLSRDCLARNMIAWHIPADIAPACTEGLRLGMIDTGINTGHAALSGARIEVIRLGDVEKGSGLQHGTAIAALLVGAPESRSPGLIPGASLVAVDTFTQRGGSDVSDAYALVRGLDLLVGRDLDVVNMSLAGPANALLQRAVESAAAADVLMVAAAGNEGPRAGAVYPAAYPSVLAVTGVDRSRRAYRRAGQGEHIDISAPGVDVWTAASVSGARPRTGTSYAAPFVAAAAALWLARNAGARPDAVVASLTSTAEDLGDPGKDKVFGWGLLRPGPLCGSGGDTPAAP